MGDICDLSDEKFQDDSGLGKLFGDGDYCDQPGGEDSVYLRARPTEGDYRLGGSGEFLVLAGGGPAVGYVPEDFDNVAQVLGQEQKARKTGVCVWCVLCCVCCCGGGGGGGGGGGRGGGGGGGMCVYVHMRAAACVFIYFCCFAIDSSSAK